MAFERKTIHKEQPDQKYWNFLKGYLITISAIFFIFFLPRMTQDSGFQVESTFDLAPLLYQSMNMGLGLILHQTHVFERSREGAGDTVLKLTGLQQLLARNLLGFLIVLFVWYKLPKKLDRSAITSEEKEQAAFKPKTLYILTGSILMMTLLVIISQML